MVHFEILYQSKKSRARVGRITTAHGVIDTPTFVPVATNASIKAVDSIAMNQLGTQLLFCNTYHLLLHPGPQVVETAGGLHSFMNRTAPLITDSGGFQVFSLAYGSVHEELKSKGLKKQTGSVLSVTEEGVRFRSYRDGAEVLLTPESSIQIQKALGADIIIPLDELPPYHIDRTALKKSLDRTHRWEKRSLDEHKKNPLHQGLFAVIHGGVDRELRAHSCAVLTALDFEGFAIGGSVGKTREEMIEMLTFVLPHIPESKPVHLLGIGDQPSLAAGIPLGIDSFDSSYPTKCARHGILFSENGPINITRSQWKSVHTPISQAPLCKEYSAAYIHHLFKAHEHVAHTLASLHNLDFMNRLMARYRQDILDDKI
ncbi:MAG: Queuine tRNA-ribosyltransferase [candidate division TM6 bacterium GW2011_GWE2_42_60]|nr:MAG: Queuine tRNA-ribosyltransferase [candidate division TM6 bacterium GW2011_GWE2_42_60]HBY05662.1 tRNA-guanine(34) transglycosylase [Candidatus Dependentiae bacterium]